MKKNCLDLESFNAVIVGNGAIGTAILEALINRPGLGQVFTLGRRERPGGEDSRHKFLPFDAENADSLAEAVATIEQSVDRVHLLINTVGFLHDDRYAPEKNLKAVTAEQLQQSFQVNAILLPLLAQAFSKLLRHDQHAVLASLSARVGSIEDNQIGGWYSYRASKAAHNMLLKSIAREWRISHRMATVVALHPGTVRSGLSEPFLSKNYPNRVLSPAESAAALLGAVGKLQPRDSGTFIDWQGKAIPW